MTATPPARCRSSTPTCERLTGVLFQAEPFASRKQDFNVRAIDTPAEHSGISRPRAGLFRDTPLGARYNSFDSERYVLTLDDRGWRDLAAAAPYDVVLILVNERKYGGGGIFNLYATAAADSAFAPYVVVHEIGHHFAGLGDEYYSSDVAYEDFGGAAVEPWEPNVTALRDPARLKWADLVSPETPLPTPWNKDEYERLSRGIQERRRELRSQGAPEERLEALFQEERDCSPGCSARSRSRAGSERSRGPCTRRRASTGPARTASCSRGTRSGSVRSAGGPSNA